MSKTDLQKRNYGGFDRRVAALSMLLAAMGAPRNSDIPQHSKLIHIMAVCNNSVVNFLVGRSYSASLSEYARRLSGANIARPMGPNNPTSADHRSNRLNIQLDSNGIVRGFRCG